MCGDCWIWRAVGSIGAAILIQMSAGGQDPAATRDSTSRESLSRLAEQPPDVALALQAAQQRLLDRIEQLEQGLASAGSESSHQWSEAIELPRLKAELRSPAPSAAVLEAIAERFYCGRPGLEASPFVAV